MKLYRFKVIKDGSIVSLVTNNVLAQRFINYKDSNRLGLRKRTANYNKLVDSKIVLTEKDIPIFKATILNEPFKNLLTH